MHMSNMVVKHHYIGYLLNVIIICCFLIFFHKSFYQTVESQKNLALPSGCPNEVKEYVKEVPREVIKEVIKEVYVTPKTVVVTTGPKTSFCPKKFTATYDVIKQCLPQETFNLISKRLQSKRFPERIIYVIMKGRLGNHMFQMLGSFMFSYLMGTKLVYVSDIIDITKIFPLFRITEEKIWKIRAKLAGLQRINDTIGVAPNTVANELLKYIKTGDVVLDNYMIDHAYIDHARNGKCRNLLKDFFQFNCNDNRVAYDFLNLIKEQWLMGRPSGQANNVVFVGIQVRRGDYMDKKWYDRGMRIPGKDYFLRAMKYFKDKFKSVIFVVATNDRKWCQDNLMADDIFMSPKFNSASADMAVLTHCNHTIGSIGSFTLWSSLLTGGIRTVYSISKQREYIPAYVEGQRREINILYS